MHALLISALLLAASATATIYYAGVAESGGEFGVYSPTATKGTGLPGRFGVDYAFLNQSTLPIWVDQNHVSLLYNHSMTFADQSLDQHLPHCVLDGAYGPSAVRFGQTFQRDVLRLLQRRSRSCHQEGRLLHTRSA